MPFVFFTSYARVNKTCYLEKFVKALSQQVLDKTKFPPEQIGFFDGSNRVGNLKPLFRPAPPRLTLRRREVLGGAWQAWQRQKGFYSS
jgi:hypothetical protein